MPIAQILTDHRPTFDQCASNSIWWYFHKLTSSTKRELYRSKMFSSCKMANNPIAANPCRFLLCLTLIAEMIRQKCNQKWLLQWCIWKLCGGRESQSAKPRRKPRPQFVLSLALTLLRTRHRTHTLDCRSPRDKIFSSSSSYLLSSPTPRGMF